jgi:hypothetical protein
MTEPLSNRPKITQTDILNQYVVRYFVKHISIPTIIEIDKKQYDIFGSNPLYTKIELKWIIAGFANDVTSKDGKIIYGAKRKNETTIDFYEKKFPGIKNVLRNPLEYFQGVDNRT